MKKIFLGFSAFVIPFFALSYGAAKMYLRPMEYMSIKEVCRRWGEAPLDVETFKSAGFKDKSTRAKMTCSLLKNQKKYIGIESRKIKELFGPQSGYFFSEAFPTYIINDPTERDRTVWQILFFVDGKHKVSEIVVHKNCCY